MSLDVTGGQPPALIHLLSPITLVQGLWRQRFLLGQYVARFVSERTRGSYLGIFWNLATPLVMLAVFTFVFSVVFEARWSPTSAEGPGVFAINMFAGLIVFEIFGSMMGLAPTLVVSNPGFVKKVVFPLEILPAAAVGERLVNALICTGVLATGAWIVVGPLPLSAVLFPLVAFLPTVMLALGAAWFLASLGVFVRDIRQFFGTIVAQVLMYLTPVFYPIERIPNPYREIIALNPLAAIIETSRAALFGTDIDWNHWFAATLLCAVLMQLGYAWFMKSKRGFADVI